MTGNSYSVLLALSSTPTGNAYGDPRLPLRPISAREIDLQENVRQFLAGAPIAELVDPGVDPAGRSMRSINIGNSGTGHGTPKPPCSSCVDMMTFFKVNF